VGRQRASALADAYEALMGAIYLDGGLAAARAVILAQYRDELGGLEVMPNLDNPKGELQERLQAESNEPPDYRLESVTGPDHDRRFECVVVHRGVEFELRQKFCYPRRGVKRREKIRCARSHCYRGGNGSKYESDDTERGAHEVAGALRERGRRAQTQAAEPGAGTPGLSPEGGDSSVTCPDHPGYRVLRLAWRQVTESWIHQQGLIKVSINQQLCYPTFSRD
jgi:hypothetical protein